MSDDPTTPAASDTEVHEFVSGLAEYLQATDPEWVAAVAAAIEQYEAALAAMRAGDGEG